ncbi:hypothetical protein JCM10212_001894 [Sporobolomyces blumeae]
MSIENPSRPAAAATRLPPELVLAILATAGRKTLRATSLVHPTWRHPSQLLLEHDLSLPSRKVAKRWLQVRGRKTWTRSVCIPVGLDTEDAEEVLDGVRDGLEFLTLVAQEGASGKSKFEIDLLEASSLKGIKTLRLTAPFSDPIHPGVEFSFPFRLSSLSFKGLYDSFPSALVSALVHSSIDTLTTLDLDTYGSQATASTFFDALVAIAPKIKHLELHGSADRTTPSLITFLTACTSLETFSCWEASLAVLCSLGATVKHLTISKNFIYHNDVPFDTLLCDSRLLDQLDKIKWPGISRATLKAQRGGGELLDDCRERGIETSFGVETIGNWYGLGVGPRRW